MSKKRFLREYGDVVDAYQKLVLLIGEDEARAELDKSLKRPYIPPEHDTKT